MKLGWTQNLVLMDADLTEEERRWYIEATLKFGWSKSELINKIESKEIQTTLAKSTKVRIKKRLSMLVCIINEYIEGYTDKLKLVQMPATKVKLIC